MGGARRKPGWGGPAGVAARFTEDEKFAVGIKEDGEATEGMGRR